jgi:hypothetical protein
MNCNLIFTYTNRITFIIITILDIDHRPIFSLKHNVSET